MKVAYLTSKYPAVSHTFVMREVAALRALGVQVGTFSVRRPRPADILGDEAAQEARHTRWLVWARPSEYVRATWWALNHPLRLLQTLAVAVAARGMSLRQRVLWLCYLGEAMLLAYWLANDKYEHLHCHFGNSGSSTGLLAAKLAGVTFSMTCHGSELLEIGYFRTADKVAESTFVACVSHHGRAQLMLACPPEQWSKLHVIRCGLSPALSLAAPNKGQSSRTILCVGRLSPEKGHLMLLDALMRLHDRGCRAPCLLVGDGPMRKAVETGAARMGLNGSLRMAGALPSDEVMGLYSSARMVVLASFTEGVPVVLIEAMASGCPVVATRVGGVGELVQDGVTGRLVAPGDPEALAEAIEWALDHPADAQSMAQRARHLVEHEFCQKTSAERLAELFHGSRPRGDMTALRMDRSPSSRRGLRRHETARPRRLVP